MPGVGAACADLSATCCWLLGARPHHVWDGAWCVSCAAFIAFVSSVITRLKYCMNGITAGP